MFLPVVTTQGKKGTSPWPRPFHFAILILLGSGLVFAFKHFYDAYEQVDGEWVARPAFRDKVDDKRDSFDDCEVYYLLALDNGLYECYHCEGNLFYLYANEIVKIGMTCNGSDRYNQSFYQAKKVRYEVVFFGNSYESSKEEVRRLGDYAGLPENMSRPDPSELSRRKRRYKLLYPVLNTTLK